MSNVNSELKELEEIQSKIFTEENKEKAVLLADSVIERVGRNWFTLNRLINRSSETRESAIQKLQILDGFGMLSKRYGDFQDGKKMYKKALFKVIITNEDRINAIDRVIDYYKGEIQKLETEKSNLLKSK